MKSSVPADSDAVLLSSSNIKDGIWHHVVVVWDRDDKAYVYVDGVEEKTFDISNIANVDISNNNPFSIGCNCKWDYTCMNFLNGKIVELGKKHNIPTPVNETLVCFIKYLEEKK